MFRAHDCTLVEVNPLSETPEGNVMVCDAKINFDDNAEFRQAAVFKHRDRTQEDPREVEVRFVNGNFESINVINSDKMLTSAIYNGA